MSKLVWSNGTVGKAMYSLKSKKVRRCMVGEFGGVVKGGRGFGRGCFKEGGGVGEGGGGLRELNGAFTPLLCSTLTSKGRKIDSV